MATTTERRPQGLPEPGTVISGRYRVEQYIAEGGMGIVARAVHTELDEVVAIKFLRPELSDAAGATAARFIQEARTATRVKGEHVARIYDAGKLESNVPFIVMELLEGCDLDQIIAERGPLPIDEAVLYVMQALEALAAAHALGMVHRDIKPANLFLAKMPDGTFGIKVVDFGIAKLLESKNLSTTTTQTVMGSPLYMAPEQMRSARSAGPAADLWACGVTLFELLTGRVPFHGENLVEVCTVVAQDPPLSLRSLRPDAPAELEAVLSRCFQKKPEDRHADVADLASALAPFGPPFARDMALRISALRRRDPSAISGAYNRASSSDLLRPLAASHPSFAPATLSQSSGWPPAQPTSALRRWAPALLGLGLVLFAGFGLVGSRVLHERRALASSAPARTEASALAPTAPATAPTAPAATAATAATVSATAPLAEPKAEATPERAATSTSAPLPNTRAPAPRRKTPPAPKASAESPSPPPAHDGLWEGRK